VGFTTFLSGGLMTVDIGLVKYLVLSQEHLFPLWPAPGSLFSIHLGDKYGNTGCGVFKGGIQN
jgi:hypothetical protein